MSLADNYSSDEDVAAGDIFGLNKISTAKKPRVDESAPALVAEAAPHVLSEVRIPH